MTNYLAFSIILFCVTSFKHIIFGLGHFDATIYHFVQFLMMNLMLLVKDGGIIKSFILWGLFGLSPHDDTNNAYDFIFVEEQKPSERRLNATATDNDLQESIHWIDDNKFIMTMIVLVSISALSFIINWVYALIKRGVCRKTQGLGHVEPSMGSILRKHRTSGYTNFFIKILLLSYILKLTLALVSKTF